MTHLLHVFIEICNDFRASLRQRIHGFYEIVRFPGVIGALDGTHVQIQAPPHEDERDYVNRKQTHSIMFKYVYHAELTTPRALYIYI